MDVQQWNDLDDVAAVQRIDASGMVEVTLQYAEQFRCGLNLGEAFALSPLPEPVDEVVILGTGGSGVGGRLLRSYLHDRCRVPIHVIQGYTVPAWVDRQSVVIAVSYSGGTEEVLSAFTQAGGRGAALLALGSGGRLGELAAAYGVPFLAVPGGLMPRAALGYLMMPLLVWLHRWGLIPDPRGEVAEALAEMAGWRHEYGPRIPVRWNRAKQLALLLAGRFPLVYGSSDYLDAVARRFKNQFGENSKCLAFWNTLPHLHHDEAVGWDMPADRLQQVGLLLLRDSEEDGRIDRRWTVTRALCAARMGVVEEVWSRGRGRFARMMSLVGLGDLTSCYLAIRQGIDPTPVAVIDRIKRELAVRFTPRHHPPGAGTFR